MKLLALAVALCGALAAAQTGQYPPGQYPPGQYPTDPNTYPPGTYPPGTYPPGTYPGSRVPGINMPSINLPKRTPKDKKEDAKMTVASVEGSLRKLGEKDLLLQVHSKDVLRFRLIPKTQFTDKAGAPIRDSLLHPGDQLTVMVNPDDEETAVRVALVHPGSDFDRAAGEQTVEQSAIRAPRTGDFGKPQTVSRGATPGGTSGGTSASGDAGRPSLARPDEVGGDVTDSPVFETESLGPLGSDDEVMRQVRSASSSYSAALPNFLVHQVTTRSFSVGVPARWQAIDQVTAELAYVDGREDYRNVMIDGHPTSRPIEQTGSWTTGDFGTTLDDILAPSTDAVFRRRGEERAGSRQAVVFDYTVAAENSHWTLVSPDGRRLNPAYQGAIWVDKDTRRVLRIEQRTGDLPRGFPFTKAEIVLNYAFARIDSKTYLMPAGGENIGCMNSGSCTRNVIEFRDYRKFVADAKIVY